MRYPREFLGVVASRSLVDRVLPLRRRGDGAGRGGGGRRRFGGSGGFGGSSGSGGFGGCRSGVGRGLVRLQHGQYGCARGGVFVGLGVIQRRGPVGVAHIGSGTLRQQESHALHPAVVGGRVQHCGLDGAAGFVEVEEEIVQHGAEGRRVAGLGVSVSLPIVVRGGGARRLRRTVQAGIRLR